MKEYDSLIIGHVTMDTNTDHLGNTVRGAGGAVLFSSAAAYALGHETGVLTKLKSGGDNRLEAFTLPPENITALPSKSSTDMVNTYFTADKERRKSVCASRGDTFFAKDVSDSITAKIYHLAGLVYGDYDDGIIKELSKKGSVAVDVQGYLRHVDPDKGGEMYFEDWKEKKELLPYITYLKTDAAEAEILTKIRDRAEAAKALHSWGAKEVIITHNTEVLVFDGKDIYTCPIKARNLSGRTGRGDTTFAAYINERMNYSVKDALLTATAAVSLKMENPGPLKADRSEILSYIDKFYGEYI